MQKIIYLFSKSVIIILLINVIGAIALNSNSWRLNKFFGIYNEILDGINSNKNRIVKFDTINFVNNLKNQQIFYSNARFERNKWIIELKKLGSESIIHEWVVDHSLLEEQKTEVKINREFSHSQPRSPLVLEDKSLILFFDELNYFFYLDSNSKVIWCNTDFQYHHTFNLRNDTIWTCGRKKINGVWENYIIALSKNNGKLLFEKALTKIILESGNHWILGCNNSVYTANTDDPYHLNDIEVVNNNSKFWEEGDLFLSLRHKSVIIHYRPNIDSVLRMIQGPFIQQHDVDVLDEARISVFNNNVSGILWDNESFKKYNINKISNICIYDFNTNRFNFPIKSSFEENNLFTYTEGLHHILVNGDIFIESQNTGTVYYFDKFGKLIYYGKLNNRDERTNWPRIYESSPIR